MQQQRSIHSKNFPSGIRRYEPWLNLQFSHGTRRPEHGQFAVSANNENEEETFMAFRNKLMATVAIPLIALTGMQPVSAANLLHPVVPASAQSQVIQVQADDDQDLLKQQRKERRQNLKNQNDIDGQDNGIRHPNRQKNADWARERFKLDVSSGPLFAIISRLVHQKGIDVIVDVADRIVEQGGQIAILGQGE
eukprot:gene35086-47146_t